MIRAGPPIILRFFVCVHQPEISRIVAADLMCRPSSAKTPYRFFIRRHV